MWNFTKNNTVCSIEMILMDEEIVSFRPLETSNPVASIYYIKLTLSNLESVHLKVTIFGTQAYRMSQYLKDNPTVNCVVIVMQFVKLNIWDGVGQAKSLSLLPL
ncbi:unnamed protein product [Lactuca virosa]|uniref:Replication protein A OB domain-containing protein n=1 Tax=Lactuca virosa TaxID=75947 RepID=A0AAU9M3Z9_9ASTR|nr:unnamed protein product [Lactuca virosa]